MLGEGVGQGQDDSDRRRELAERGRRPGATQLGPSMLLGVGWSCQRADARGCELMHSGI